MAKEDLSQISTLDELEKIVEQCELCPLKETRNKVVFGVGSPEADLLFIGEAPGFHEDQKGEPFVGAAGRLLDELLVSILGLTRQDIYIANVLKCRPPGNRDPLPEEIEHCRPFLQRQAQIIDPKIICSLGNHATRVVMRKNINISKMHGKLVKMGERRLFPTYHPAAGLYSGATKELIIEDFQKLKTLLQVDPGSGESNDEALEQMGLF